MTIPALKRDHELSRGNVVGRGCDKRFPLRLCTKGHLTNAGPPLYRHQLTCHTHNCVALPNNDVLTTDAVSSLTAWTKYLPSTMMASAKYLQNRHARFAKIVRRQLGCPTPPPSPHCAPLPTPCLTPFSNDHRFSVSSKCGRRGAAGSRTHASLANFVSRRHVRPVLPFPPSSPPFPAHATPGSLIK